MRGITVDQSVVDQIFGVKPVPVAESKKEEKIQESEEHGEVHVCPLCESELQAPISEEKIDEHVNWILGVINENFEVDGADLDETSDEESEDEDTKEE